MPNAERLSDVAVRAREWVRANQAAVCDQITPWEFGTVVRATRFPDYYSYNLVRVEREPDLNADALIDVAARALSPLRHRRLDFEVLGAAEALRPEFMRRGWGVDRLIWMRHEAPLPSTERVRVSEAFYDDVAHLRERWHGEGRYAAEHWSDFAAQAREVALRRRLRVLAVQGGEQPIAFATLDVSGRSAEIHHVYVAPEHRGRGLGTALTAAAIELAGSPDDLWICADDEDRPKHLYGRLGFRGVWRSISFDLTPAG